MANERPMFQVTRPAAYPTVTLASIRVQIRSAQFMSTTTVRATRLFGHQRLAAQDIRPMCNRFKVSWVNATSRSTAMIEF
jgi:hypothetical protein